MDIGLESVVKRRAIRHGREVEFIAQFEKVQLGANRAACLLHTRPEMDGVGLIQFQAMNELDVAESVIGLEKSRAIIDL